MYSKKWVLAALFVGFLLGVSLHVTLSITNPTAPPKPNNSPRFSAGRLPIGAVVSSVVHQWKQMSKGSDPKPVPLHNTLLRVCDRSYMFPNRAYLSGIHLKVRYGDVRLLFKVKLPQKKVWYSSLTMARQRFDHKDEQKWQPFPWRVYMKLCKANFEYGPPEDRKRFKTWKDLETACRKENAKRPSEEIRHIYFQH